MKKRMDITIGKSTLIQGTGFEIAITTDGQTVARYERYSYGKLSGEWSDWDTLPRALQRLTMSRGQSVRRAIERAYIAGYRDAVADAGMILTEM